MVTAKSDLSLGVSLLDNGKPHYGVVRPGQNYRVVASLDGEGRELQFQLVNRSAGVLRPLDLQPDSSDEDRRTFAGDITPDEELKNMGDIQSGIITTMHHYSAAGNRPANKAFVEAWHKAMAEQLLPIAHDCYNSALRQDPKLAGTLFFDFTLIGVEEIGGVIEEAEIGEESTLDSEFVRECLRESLMIVTFDPPPDGGRTKITYGPLTFEPDE